MAVWIPLCRCLVSPQRPFGWITFATIPTVVRHPKTRNISGRAVVVEVTETAAAMEPQRHRMNRRAWQGWAPLCSSSWSSWADWQCTKSVPSFNTVGGIAILPRWLRHENTKAVRTKMMVARCIAIMSTTMMPAKRTRREKSRWYRNGPLSASECQHCPASGDAATPSAWRCCNTVSLCLVAAVPLTTGTTQFKCNDCTSVATWYMLC
jgi:hypothetical protein